MVNNGPVMAWKMMGEHNFMSSYIHRKFHSEKRFDGIKENNLFERLFLIQTKDLFWWNGIF